MMLCDGHRNKHLGQIIDRRAKVAIVSGTGTGFAVNTPWLSWLIINCEVLCGRTRGGLHPYENPPTTKMRAGDFFPTVQRALKSLNCGGQALIVCVPVVATATK